MTGDRAGSPIDRFDVAAVIAIVALVHGVMLFGDRAFWDGLLIASYHDEHRPDLLWDMFVTAGAPFGYPMHRLFGAVPGFPFGYKLGAFVCFVVAGLGSYVLGLRTRYLSRFESVFLAGAVVTVPAVATCFELVMVPYAMCLACSIAGACLGLRARSASPAASWALRLAAVPLFACAFSVRSFLVLSYAHFAYFVLFHEDSQRTIAGLGARVRRALPRHGELLVLPVAYWITVERACPRSENYQDYNRIRPSVGSAVHALASFTKTAFFTVTKNDVVAFVTVPFVAIPAALAIWALFRRIGSAPSARTASLRDLVVVAGGAFLAASFAYAAVGIGLGAAGWGQRHGLITGFGVGLFAIAAARAALGGRYAHLAPMIFAAYLAAAAARNARYYVAWQARGVKDRAIVVALHALPEPRWASVVYVDDHLPLGDEPAPTYRFYEWSTFFERAWGDERRVGVMVPTARAAVDALQPGMVAGYNASDVDLAGCAAHLVIDPAPEYRGPLALVAAYEAARFGGGDLDAVLAHVVRLTFERDPADDGARCVAP